MKKLLILLVTTLVVSCSTTPKKATNKIPWPAKNPDEISVMSFNVENLFDNIHDENREDQTYLPLVQKNTDDVKAACAKIKSVWNREECLKLDWSDAVVNAKLKNVSEVILSADGTGPDNLILIEVENERILGRLNKEFLSKAGYQTQVLIEGPDERGIDIAFLSRFPMVGSPVLHKIPYKGKNDEDQKWMNRSRGILEVTVKLPDGEPLTFFGAHFPSQANPRYWREQSVDFLASLIKERSAKGMVIAGGDLNISHNEEVEARFFKNDFSQVAMVSHLVGCKSCKGSHAYRQEWSFLDALLFSKNLGPDGSAAYILESNSIDILRYNDIHLYGDQPKRFDTKKMEGVSDHFPLYSRLTLRKKE